MHVIGIDLGGTKVAGAVFDSHGQILEETYTTINKQTGKAVGQLIVTSIQHLLSRAQQLKLSVRAVGVCIPGIYYVQRGRVWAPNIPGWDDYPLLEELQAVPELQDKTIVIDSDRACYILGETWAGNARGCRNAIFLAVGTGIGAGILIDGKILRGQQDIAGAIGWLAMNRPFRQEYASCGCFEYHASGEGLVKVTRDLLTMNPDYKGELAQKPSDQLSSHDIFQAHDKGDALASEVLDQAIQFWGMAAANLVSTFNPETIIFGGGVFGPAGRWINRIYEEAARWAQPISIKQVTFEISALAGRAGLIGAGRLAYEAIQ